MELRNYHKTPRDYKFFWSQKEQKKHQYQGLTIGLEIEVEGNYDCSQEKIVEIASAYNWIIACETDGSLGQYGVEIITHPMSYNFLKENKKQIRELINRLRASGCTSHDNGRCGLHVNFGRGPLLTPCVTYKMIKLIKELGNIDCGRLLRRITRRADLTRWSSTAYSYSPARLARSSNARVYEGRYRFINLQNNNVVEFRGFRGTLIDESFFASIEFCKKFAEFCTKTSIQNCNANNFLWLLQLSDFTRFSEYFTKKINGKINTNKKEQLAA